MAYPSNAISVSEKLNWLPQSDLFIFSGGAKNAAPEEQAKAVRDYLKMIDGFRAVKVIERNENTGLPDQHQRSFRGCQPVRENNRDGRLAASQWILEALMPNRIPVGNSCLPQSCCTFSPDPNIHGELKRWIDYYNTKRPHSRLDEEIPQPGYAGPELSLAA